MSLVNETHEKITEKKLLTLDGILRDILNENEEYSTLHYQNEFLKQSPAMPGESDSFYLNITDEQALNDIPIANEICSNTSNTLLGLEFARSELNGGHELHEAPVVKPNQVFTIPKVTTYQEEPTFLPTAPQAQLVHIGK